MKKLIIGLALTLLTASPVLADTAGMSLGKGGGFSLGQGNIDIKSFDASFASRITCESGNINTGEKHLTSDYEAGSLSIGLDHISVGKEWEYVDYQQNGVGEYTSYQDIGNKSFDLDITLYTRDKEGDRVLATKLGTTSPMGIVYLSLITDHYLQTALFETDTLFEQEPWEDRLVIVDGNPK
ncbi:MAG: hypothetical protein V7750_07335 [Sneathiella sp.]